MLSHDLASAGIFRAPLIPISLERPCVHAGHLCHSTGLARWFRTREQAKGRLQNYCTIHSAESSLMKNQLHKELKPSLTITELTERAAFYTPYLIKKVLMSIFRSLTRELFWGLTIIRLCAGLADSKAFTHQGHVFRSSQFKRYGKSLLWAFQKGALMEHPDVSD